MKMKFQPGFQFLVAAAVLGVATLCGSQAAYAGSIGGAWIAIYDGTNSDTYTLGSSVSDFTYVTPGDSGGNGVLAGAFATQVGAVLFDVQEGPGVLGQASAHFEYADLTPLANGNVQSVNFNISGPDDQGVLSDTLSITFTGHSDGTNNMSIDLHFLSDNDVIFPSSLTNGISLMETGQYQDLSATIQGVTGLSNFNLKFTSDVIPEPASLILVGLGLVGIVGGRRLRHCKR